MKISGFLSWWSLLKTTLSCFARYICVKCRDSLSRIRSKFRVFAHYSTIFCFQDMSFRPTSFRFSHWWGIAICCGKAS